MTLATTNLTDLALSQIVQVTVLVLAVSLVVRLFCRHRPHLAYFLWLLVLLKCVAPPLWSSPTGMFSWAQLRIETARVASSTATFPIKELEPPPTLHDSITTEETVVDAPGISIASVLSTAWLCGACVLASVVLCHWLRVRAIVRHASMISDEANSMAAQLIDNLGIRQRVRIRVTCRPLSPAVYGVFRPVVILPEVLLRSKTRDDLKPILAHELVHIRRCDGLVAALQVFVQIIWWFHPLIWWSNRQITRERERACDEEVVASLACTPNQYANSLLDVLQNVRQLNSVIALPGVHPIDITSKRLEHIMKKSRQFHRKTPRLCWFIFVVTSLIVLPGAGLTFRASGEPVGKADVKGSKVTDETDASGATGQGEADSQLSAEERNAEAALRKLGARIHRNTNREVLGVWVYEPGFRDEDFEHLRRLNWSKAPSSGPPPSGGDMTYYYPALQINAAQVTDAGLEKLPGIAQFSYLALTNNPNITENSLQRLNGLTKVLRLNLNDTGITDAALANLKRLPNLEWLFIGGTKVTDAGLKSVREMRQLGALSLRNTEITDGGLLYLSNLDLATLDLEGTGISDAGLAHLKSMRNLEVLQLGRTNITGSGLAYLADIHHLTGIDLHETEVDDTDLAHLKSMTDLEWLRLGATKVTDAGIAHLKDLVKLRFLRLAATKVSGSGLIHLKALDNLDYLSLSGTKIDNAALTHLKGLKSLTQLRLRATGINDTGLQNVRGLINLVDLGITDTNITDNGLEHLKGLKKLKVLTVNGTDVSDAGIDSLKEALPNCNIDKETVFSDPYLNR